jgi:hypothetical protein
VYWWQQLQHCQQLLGVLKVLQHAQTTHGQAKNLIQFIPADKTAQQDSQPTLN